LHQLKEELQTQYNAQVYALVFDVRNKEEVYTAINNLPQEWQQIDVLINNAGLAAGRDLFDEASMDDWETMIDTNVKGLLYVSRAVLPFMTVKNSGHIINIGSTAAKEVYERGNVYCASKAAVDSITKAMRMDLLQHKIKVTAIHPGAAETEFSMVRFKGDQTKADAVYAGYTPLYAEDVAEVVYYTTTLPAHVCINDLVLTCTAQANSFYTYKS
jgi:3-hydroxy acid dehydrogenase / malonic semialdehyde reductase